MIYLRLFLTFLEIGAVSFGGGYAMISLISEAVVSNGWLTEAEVLNLVAVAESTPGPIAVNAATFVGSTQGGVLGSLLATLGVVLPSFVIILIISALIRGLLQYAGVDAFLHGVRPCVVGLICGTGITMALKTLFAMSDIRSPFVPDLRGILLFAALWIIRILWKKKTKKAPSPILMILFSALYGIAVYR